MRLFFTGGTEHIRLDIDRNGRKAVIRTSMTAYAPKDIKFYELFPGKKRQQKVVEKVVSGYDDKRFIEIVEKSIGMAGYMLIKVVKDESS